MSESPMPLAADFPAATHEQWRDLVAGVVNKRRPEDKQLTPEQAEASLRTMLPGAVEIEPLYLKPEQVRALGVPGAMPFTRGRGLRERETPWDVRQLHDDPDVARTREAVLDDLEHGVTSVWVHVGPDGVAADDLAAVLADVRLDLAPVVVSSWQDQRAAAEALLAVLRGGEAATVSGNLGLDPLGAAARTGAAPDLAGLADAVQAVAELPHVQAICVDTRPYHDAGATAVDEIALAVATGVAYLRRLESDGVAPAQAVTRLAFRFAATADQFLTAATLRAFRRVWARVAELCGVPEADRGAFTHAVTSDRMFTRDDPYTNILRSTLAAFGATLGGADAVTVRPFDTVTGLPTPFSRRVARNTQIVLADESNVGMVTDPAGGSWYVEDLTDDLAAKAWTAFQEIEAAGGVERALADGEVARRIEAGIADRDRALVTRRQPITGVSMFPMVGERPIERRPRAAVETSEGALLPHRDSEIYERLRDRATAYEQAHGTPPSVVVAALGSRRDFGARETFALNVLAAGGVVGRTVEGDAAALARAAADSGAPVVLASSPKGYAAHAADALAALRDAGVSQVLVAGRARELDGASVDGEIYDGMDVVAFLDDLLTTLGAPKETSK